MRKAHHRIDGLEGNIQIEQQRQTAHDRIGGLEDNVLPYIE